VALASISGDNTIVYEYASIVSIVFHVDPTSSEVVVAAIQVHPQNVPVWDQRLIVAIFGKYYVALTMLHA
jgi:hypothetical protein